MKNRTYEKKISLFIAILALGISAFSNVKSKIFNSVFLVQSAESQFTTITVPQPGESNCEGVASLQCYYECAVGRTLPAPSNGAYYTPLEINTYLSSNIIIRERSSSGGLYVP